MLADICSYTRVEELVLASVSQLALFVLIHCGTGILISVINRYHQYLADQEFGREQKCQLPPELPKRWPLGIDRIKELWDSNAEGRLLSFLCSLAKDYEPGNNLYQFLLVGPRAFHVLHPVNLETVLSLKADGMRVGYVDYGFGCRPAVFAPLLGKGIFTQEGIAWRHSRDLLRKQFMRVQSQSLDRFCEHVDNLIACIPTAGEVDLQPLFFKLTLDTTTALLFGRSVYSLRADIDQDVVNKGFSESFDIALDGLSKRFRIAPFHFLYAPPRFRRACRNVHRFVEGYIDEAGEDGASWFMDRGSRSNDEIRDQLVNILLAGRDTTACCLSWTFRLLVRHPHIMQRLRSEVAIVMRDTSSPTREQVRNMPFLACVVKESLRLYPPVPLNNREAIRTTVLPTGGGPDGKSPILVRKGELVVFSPYVNSRKRNIYGPDAELFRPERWETGELADIGWAYFPFSGGPRRCLGEDFALMEVYYTVVKLLQTFPCIELPSNETNEPVGTERQRLSLVLACADGCRISTASPV
ncbi:cytochrome P450 [Poronia punctata]|nr:cytochrome P450 [Poronia punctata]